MDKKMMVDFIYLYLFFIENSAAYVVKLRNSWTSGLTSFDH